LAQRGDRILNATAASAEDEFDVGLEAAHSGHKRERIHLADLVVLHHQIHGFVHHVTLGLRLGGGG